MLKRCMSSCVIAFTLSTPLRVVIRGQFGRHFDVGLGTISGVVLSAIFTSFPVSFQLCTKHYIERCFKDHPKADSDAILALIWAPSGCSCGRHCGRSLGRSVCAVSGVISALVRAPFRHGIEHHSGASSSAIRACHQAPFGRGIERHSGAASSDIRALHRVPFGRGIKRNSGTIWKAISSVV